MLLVSVQVPWIQGLPYHYPGWCLTGANIIQALTLQKPKLRLLFITEKKYIDLTMEHIDFIKIDTLLGK